MSVVQEFFKNGDGIICKEWEYIRKRRENHHLEIEKFEKDICNKTSISIKIAEPQNDITAPFKMVGVALSGGGIRSATFCLGALKSFAKHKIFRQIDYLSTVSGGGYTGAFVQKRICDLERAENSLDEIEDNIFDPEEIAHLQTNGNYLMPNLFERLNFYIVNTLLSLLHILWYILFFAAFFYIVINFGHFVDENIKTAMSQIIIKEYALYIFNLPLILLVFTLAYYYFFHGLRHIKRWLWSDRYLFYAMTIFTSFYLLSLLFAYTITLPLSTLEQVAILLGILFLGLFANPNILSSHRFYRYRLKDVFLKGDDIRLDELNKDKSIAPYHLINTTLNIQNDKRKNSDYFLLSAYYCGSKKTKYALTNETAYKKMTLATAITISGAALNPQMGLYTNRVLAFFMTLLNLRLGYWALNPLVYKEDKQNKNIFNKIAISLAKRDITFWPWYNLAELFGKSNIHRTKINLSDGGHIENLGVFELLRRRCFLIFAIDASADPNYTFDDLKNLQIRARNELEIAIKFDVCDDPLHVIKPKLKDGFSQRSYAIACMYELTDDKNTKNFFGYFIYIKASITAQKTKLSEKDKKNAFYSYKNYHPKFPHEPTSDQIFDICQWEAYYKLGENIVDEFFKDFDQEPSLQNLEAYIKSMWQGAKAP